jgi:two-component system nitrogen regulation sensor histidine kinase NtrY
MGIFTLSIRGQPVHVETSGLRLLDEQGATQGLVLMFKDVTQLQRSQRALAWREVARRVAHEIKNPLTPIQTSAERIRRKYLDILSADGTILDTCTQTIIENVKSLKKMVNEFSQFATLPESKPVPDDLNAVMREMARFYEHGLPEHVRVRLDLDPKVPPFPIDREQLKRAFTNLIDNAAASIRTSGEIVLRSAYDPEAHQVRVDVADDGSGVPDDIQKRLFEPYTSTKVGGTGLGLTIVNQIVSDHNGVVRYAPNKPHGSVFSMEFRLAQ